MFQCYLADISQVVTCLPSLPVTEGSDVTFLCLMPCAALNMWSRTAYFVLPNKCGVLCPSVSVILFSVFHYSALFDLFLLDAVQLELFFDVFSHVFCLCGSSYTYQKQTKTNKTHINLIFFFFKRRKKKLYKGLKPNPPRSFSMIDPGQRCDTQNRVA